VSICYAQGDKLPENGWMVVCHVLGRYVHVTTLDELVITMGGMADEARRQIPDRESPISVFELGREMHVSLNYALTGIRPR
jgi:hypothetical protein